MAKGKKKPSTGKPDGGSVDSIAQGTASLSIGGKKAANAVHLFPLKPLRAPGQDGPGQKVVLITNLFRMSMLSKQVIYRFTLTIDKIEDSAGSATGEPKPERKLSKEIRKMALDEAIKTWLRKNPPKALPKKIKFTYVYDNNGSIVYTLFDIFATNPNDSTMDLDVNLNLDTIVEQKLTQRPQSFRVKFFRGDSKVVDLDQLFNYCKGTPGNCDITRVQDGIRAVNVILHGEVINIDRFVVTPYSCFDYYNERNRQEIGPKVLLKKGFSMSARPTATGLVLNVANSYNAFHEESSLLDLVVARYRIRDLSQPLRDYHIDDLKKEIKNKQIEARHINYGSKERPHYRKYRVTNIDGSAMDKFNLVNRDTNTVSEITIQEYFKREYKVNLKYPKLPCVVDKGRKIPLEVCHLVDKQRVTRKMTGDETSKTIKIAAVRPEEHFRGIHDSVKVIGQISQPLTDFGLTFDRAPIEVTGRELQPTFLTGKSKAVIKPNDGQYNVNRELFLKPAQIRVWVVLALLDRSMEELRAQCQDLRAQEFSKKYVFAAQRKGIQINPIAQFRTVAVSGRDVNDVKIDLKKEFALYNERKVDHAIILLPKDCPDYMYRYLQYLETCRQAASRKTGESYTRTSCVKFDNYKSNIFDDRKAEMFISNLLLKYNTKLGGINFALADNPTDRFLKDGFLFISVDVCHPAPGDKLSQSVAAAVGMWDLNNVNRSYRTCIRVQRKVRENHSTIEDVGEIDRMFEDILGAYKAKKQALPKNIVLLRDGVSEGQLKIVLEGELVKVYALLSRLYTNSKLEIPKVTCMVVQKRHKVRFMRKVPHPGRKGPDFNVQPGTVVDSEITHPTDFTFYLAPHKAIQGTSRAAHIYVIHDKIGFSQDEAQAMVHALCYLSPRCTKSTSIPTPVNLADLAAERGKNLVISWQEDNIVKPKKGKAGGDTIDKDDEHLIALNDYLQNIADSNYRNTLFYV